MNLIQKKKGEGVVANAAMLGMTILVGYIVIILLFNYYKTIHAHEEINMIARTYLLKMELHNCLEQSDIIEMVNKLTDLGMSDIELSGNFSSSVSSTNIKANYYPSSYGKEVFIQIEGILNVDTKVVNVLGINIDISKPMVNINITKKGVSVK